MRIQKGLVTFEKLWSDSAAEYVTGGIMYNSHGEGHCMPSGRLGENRGGCFGLNLFCVSSTYNRKYNILYLLAIASKYIVI